MNILLLTYSFNYNYGGLLQAYATVKFLQKQGHVVTVPTCFPDHMIGNTSFFRGLGLKSASPVKAVFRRMRQVRRYQRFDKFRKQLGLDEGLSGKAAITSSLNRFDVVLTGSDQTWNTKFMPKYDSYYYQGFIGEGIRKVSYAACFGTKEQRPEILRSAAPDIEKFDAISVRNSVSRDIVEKLVGVIPEVVVDPTLLYDFDELLLAPESPKRRPFVMVYALDANNFPMAELIVRELRCREPDIEIHFINGEKNFDKPHWATHFINSYGPAEFLAAMQAASYVVTDSFHGLIFSQKLGRPCIPYTSGWRSERIIDLVNDFSAAHIVLTDENISKVKDIVSEVVDEGVRFEISSALREKIDRSEAYLLSALAS